MHERANSNTEPEIYLWQEILFKEALRYLKEASFLTAFVVSVLH